MNERGVLATHSMSPISKITHPENISQIKLLKDPNSNRVNISSIHNTLPVTLCSSLLTFRDTDKNFELKGDLMKMITNENYNVDLASLLVKKSMILQKRCI